MEKLKDLIIINGVTGAIGSAVLAEYACQKNTCIYGLSRKALDVDEFTEKEKLPDKTLICSVGEMYESHMLRFLIKIDFTKFKSVTYVHAIGHYPFEVNEHGEVAVSDDKDGDGINDECARLFRVFRSTVETIDKLVDKKSKNFKYKAVIFGSIADKSEPIAHSSWWKSMKKTKHWMQCSETDFCFYLINVSSVMCPHELITRPFVFIQTDADHMYWLKPADVAYMVRSETSLYWKKYDILLRKSDLFKKKPGFSDTYYNDENFTPRKVAELFKKA